MSILLYFTTLNLWCYRDLKRLYFKHKNDPEFLLDLENHLEDFDQNTDKFYIDHDDQFINKRAPAILKSKTSKDDHIFKNSLLNQDFHTTIVRKRKMADIYDEPERVVEKVKIYSDLNHSWSWSNRDILMIHFQEILST